MHDIFCFSKRLINKEVSFSVVGRGHTSNEKSVELVIIQSWYEFLASVIWPIECHSKRLAEIQGRDKSSLIMDQGSQGRSRNRGNAGYYHH